MSYYEHIPADRDDADFAVVLEDDSLAPWAGAGDTVYLARSAELDDGDIGLFAAGGGMVFRQFCQDIRGTVYLLSPDRSKKELDLRFPAGSRCPVCYGKVLLNTPVPLPLD